MPHICGRLEILCNFLGLKYTLKSQVYIASQSLSKIEAINPSLIYMFRLMFEYIKWYLEFFSSQAYFRILRIYRTSRFG